MKRIAFSGQMVTAILTGQKKQTRRLLKSPAPLGGIDTTPDAPHPDGYPWALEVRGTAFVQFVAKRRGRPICLGVVF